MPKHDRRHFLAMIHIMVSLALGANGRAVVYGAGEGLLRGRNRRVTDDDF